MKSNLERHICHDKTFGMAFNKESSTYQKMCFAIALFHSSVNERRGYSMCGWNQGHDDSNLPNLHALFHHRNQCVGRDLILYPTAAPS